MVKSPISQWKMNDNAADTTVADAVGSNVGTLAGGDNTEDISTTGKINRALDFDGASDVVSIPNASSLNPTEITITMWVKFNEIPYSGQIGLNKEGQYRFIAGDVDSSHLSIRYATTTTGWTDGKLAGNTVLTSGVWYYAVATYDGSSWKLYLNGNLDGQTAESGTILSKTPLLYIGSHNAGPTGHYFNGMIDDVRIYNFSLSYAEQLAIFNHGRGTEDENPFAFPGPPYKTLSGTIQEVLNKLQGENLKAGNLLFFSVTAGNARAQFCRMK
ncbi:MAG: LamG domain-containing protein [Candidatus Aminicenantes bacterium]|nr:MAG: LamG domain-containing protein [Candidatus Aminicenantes bacterium]